MSVAPLIERVFGSFQNLNLLILLEDLRAGQTAHGSWTSGALLCPVAHGISAGGQINHLRLLEQTAPLRRACDHAARDLGAGSFWVYEFVRRWDAQTIGHTWLLEQLEALWAERLDDALAMQEVLQGDALATIEEPQALGLG
jgi:hypothetical protein